MLNFRSLFINKGKERLVIPSFKVEDVEFVEKDNEDCYINVYLADKTIQRLDFGYYNNWYFDGIKIEGHVGTWYTIDTQITDGVLYLLLEHEEYGDETACVIIDIDGNLILEDVWNGLDDLDEYLGLYGENSPTVRVYYEVDFLDVVCQEDFKTKEDADKWIKQHPQHKIIDIVEI